VKILELFSNWVEAKLRELIIENKKLLDLSELSTAETEALTIGELMVYADAIEALEVITGYGDRRQAAEETAALYRAFSQVSKGPRGETTVNTASGPVQIKDIPRDPATGNFDEAWVNDNCDCPEHRAARLSKSTEEYPQSNVGTYL